MQSTYQLLRQPADGGTCPRTSASSLSAGGSGGGGGDALAPAACAPRSTHRGAWGEAAVGSAWRRSVSWGSCPGWAARQMETWSRMSAGAAPCSALASHHGEGFTARERGKEGKEENS